MRELTTAKKDLIESSEYQVHYKVEVEDGNGNWVDLTNLEGYDFVNGGDIDADVDSPVKESNIKLFKSIYDLNLSPTMEESKLNRVNEDLYKPLLDLVRKCNIYTAITAVGETPSSADWDLIIEGQIQNMDWSGKEPFVDMIVHDMGARIRDRKMEFEKTYGGMGGLLESAVSGDTKIRVLYTSDVTFAPGGEEEGEIFVRKANYSVTPSGFETSEEYFTVEEGDKIEYTTVKEFGGEASIVDPDGNLYDSGNSSGEIQIDSGNEGTWKIRARRDVFYVGVSATVYDRSYPELGADSDCIITGLDADGEPIFENVTIINAERVPTWDAEEDPEDADFVYDLTLATGLDNNYEGHTEGKLALIGKRIDDEIQRILDDVGLNDVDFYVDRDPEFIISGEGNELGHAGTLEEINSMVDLLGWVIKYRWYDTYNAFRFALREPEREKVVELASNANAGDNYLEVTRVKEFSPGDEIITLSSDYELAVVDYTTEYDPSTEDPPRIYLTSPLNNSFTELSTVAKYDYIISPNNIIDATRLEADKGSIRNAIKAEYSDTPYGEEPDTGHIKPILMENEDSIEHYERLYMEVTQKALPTLSQKRYAINFVESALSDLSYPKVLYEFEMRYFPYVQEDDVLVFMPDDLQYDTPQVFAVTGYTHSFNGKTTVRTRGKPSGGYHKWHEMDVFPGNAPAVRSVQPIRNLKYSVGEESDVDGEPIIPPKYFIQLDWKAPRQAYSGFELRYKKVGDTNWTFDSTGSVGFKIDGLEPHTEYKVGVRVVGYTGGESNTVRRSEWIEVTIVLEINAPQSVTIDKVDYEISKLEDGTYITTISLFWTPPESKNYAKGHVYYRVFESGADWWGVGNAVDNIQFISSIQGETLEFAVASENWVGDIQSMEDAAKATKYIPGKEEPPSATLFDKIYWGADYIKITWQPNPDDDFDEYEIRLDDDFGSDA